MAGRFDALLEHSPLAPELVCLAGGTDGQHRLLAHELREGVDGLAEIAVGGQQDLRVPGPVPQVLDDLVGDLEDRLGPPLSSTVMR